MASEIRISRDSGTPYNASVDDPDPTAKGNGRYTVEMFTYPEDLFGSGASQYGKCWTMIYINVMANSGSIDPNSPGGGFGVVDLTEAEKRRKYGSYSQQRQNTTTAQAVGAAATAGAGAGLLSKFLSSGTSVGAAALGGAATGALAALPAAVTGTTNRETKRLQIAIQLPMPNNLIFNYNAEWGEDNTALFDLIMRTGRDVGNFDASSAMSNASDAALNQILKMNSVLGNGAISAATGLAANPKKELIFNGINFRRFTLEYRFYPKTFMEYYKVNSIINTLKYHMHPEYRGEGKYTFVYPSEFDILFYGEDGAENPWIGKMATCVLENMTVNYTPDGLWANHKDGVPNSVNISLVFKELAILTKDDIEKIGF